MIIFTQFEYQSIKLNIKTGFDMSVLKKMGRNGWRFVQTYGEDGHIFYLFEKRFDGYNET